MPVYCYKCAVCGLERDVFKHNCPTPGHFVRAGRFVRCRGCGGVAKRHYLGEQKNTDLVDRERFSDSMGINPDQLELAKKTFPDSEYDSEGRLKIKNRKHKLYEMKRRGYIEYD